MSRILICVVAFGCIVLSERNPNTSSQAGEHLGEPIYVRKLLVPGHPPLAHQALVQGEVSALMHIRADGTVESLSHLEGPPLLVGHVAEALKSWEFVLPNREPTELKVRILYSLRGQPTKQNVVRQVSAVLPDFVEVVTSPLPPPGPDVEYPQGRRPKN